MSSFRDARLATLAALFIEYHREPSELFDFEELAAKYHLKYDPAWFRPIITELRSLLIVSDTKDGISVALRPDGYGTALEQLLARAQATQLQIDWRKEEILSDASDIDWFPSPNGWKYLQFAKDVSTPMAVRGSPVSQKKIDLAVLLKMYEDAEAHGWWVTRHDIQKMFSIPIPMRRIELATEKLFADGDILRDYDPLNLEESRWQLSRPGFTRVERALTAPTSFIARLAANGDEWLESEEAKKAVLKTLKRPTPEPGPDVTDDNPPLPPNIKITNTFVPVATTVSDDASSRSVAWASWTNALIALGIGIATIIASLWVAGKF